MDIQGEINSSTVIVGDFNIPLISLDRFSNQKISEETEALNDTLDQMDLMIFLELVTPKQQNIYSFQVHMEHFPG